MGIKRLPGRRPGATEREVQRSCLAALPRLGVLAWRNNTGAARYGERHVRFGVPGLGDILGVLPGGRALMIECKGERGRVTEAQRACIDNFNRQGGLAFVARSLDGMLIALRAEGVIK